MSNEGNSSVTNKQENYSLTWEQAFNQTFDTLEWQIKKYLKQLNLRNISLNEIKNDIFLILTKLISSGRLEYKIIEDNFVFINIKPNEPKEPIESFRAWLRKVIFNHLKKLRKAQNKILNLDNCSHYHSREKYFGYIEKRELLEKLKSLGDEERRILEMFYFQRLSYQEIAACLQLEGFPRYSNVNLRKKKERALEKLRNLY